MYYHNYKLTCTVIFFISYDINYVEKRISILYALKFSIKLSHYLDNTYFVLI